MIIIVYCTIIVFVIGAAMGSFLNALADRLFNEEDFVKARSACSDCNHTLAWYDLIPIVSYLQLKGKCRYCHAHIPLNLLISEILLGIFYALSFIVAKDLLLVDTTHFYIYWLFLLFNISFFFFIGVYDYKYYIIPDRAVYVSAIVYVLILIGIVCLHSLGISFFGYHNYGLFLFQHIITGILLFVFFLAIYLVTQGKGIGGGDVKLSFPIGVLLGAKPTIVFLYIAFFSGAVVSLLLLLNKKKQMKDAIPFGPFLSFGVIIALLYANAILSTPLFSFINYLSALF